MELIDIVAIFASFVSLVFLGLFAKKMYYRFYLHKRFFIIPRVSSKGIANIGMILALSISVVLILILITANAASLVFRLWAGTRVLIEGILIKIGGLLFGPIIGMCLGLAVDLLTITYSGGIFNFGYLMAAVLFGLIGGLIRMLLSSTKSNEFKFTVWSSIISILVVAGSLTPIILSDQDVFFLSFFGVDINISKMIIFIILVLTPVVGLIVMWICYYIQFKQLKKDPAAKRWYKNFAPVLITILLSEIVINVVMMPFFDAQLSTLTYDAWFAIRLLLLVPMVVINVIIILPVYSIINPIITYRYEDELVEDMDKPIYVS